MSNPFDLLGSGVWDDVPSSSSSQPVLLPEQPLPDLAVDAAASTGNVAVSHTPPASTDHIVGTVQEIKKMNSRMFSKKSRFSTSSVSNLAELSLDESPLGPLDPGPESTKSAVPLDDFDESRVSTTAADHIPHTHITIPESIKIGDQISGHMEYRIQTKANLK